MTRTAGATIRRRLRRRKIRHIIPEPRDQRAHRRRHGPAAGRPTGFDAERYNKRDVVERAINRLKNFRAVATRYANPLHLNLGDGGKGGERRRVGRLDRLGGQADCGGGDGGSGQRAVHDVSFLRVGRQVAMARRFGGVVTMAAAGATWSLRDAVSR
jgi:transposase